jgi:hypothetical protein
MEKLDLRKKYKHYVRKQYRNQVISSGLGGLRALWAAYRRTVLGQLFFLELPQGKRC